MLRLTSTSRSGRSGLQRHLGLLMTILMIALSGTPVSNARPAVPTTPATLLQQNPDPLARTLSKTPAQIAFVPNAGQSDRNVRFQAQSALGTLFFDPKKLTLALPVSFPTDPDDTLIAGAGMPGRGRTRQAFATIQQHFVGARQAPKITGLEPLPGKVNYVIGTNPASWHTNISSFAAIQYRSLYPGIDLRYDGKDGQLKSSFLLQPGANPDLIRWHYRGVDTTQIDPATGDLQMTVQVRLTPAMQAELHALKDTTTITLTEHAPVAWQETSTGRRAVAVRFELAHNGTVRLVLGAYDPSIALTIDPTISYTETFGGSGTEAITDLAVHPDESLVITGWTSSTDLPNSQGSIGTILGETYVLASKRDGATGAAEWTTYFGGNYESAGEGIAVLPTGNLVLTGYTRSDAYPQIPATLPACTRLRQNLIVATLSASDGTLLTNRCLGTATSDNVGAAVAVAHVPTPSDPNAHTIWIGGSTFSGEFLPASPGSVRYVYGTDPSQSGTGFLVQLASDVQTVRTRIYLGGSGSDGIADLALDAQQRPSVTGTTTSINPGAGSFPTTTNAYQALSTDTSFSYRDAFAAQFAADGSQLRYSTFLSGSNSDWGQGIAVEGGDLYVTGSTSGQNGESSFASTPATAWRTTLVGGSDTFVVRLDPEASSGVASLVYGTILGSTLNGSTANGTGSDSGYSIAARDGIAYVIGRAGAENFTIESPLAPFQGREDLFVAALDTTVRRMLFSTFAGTTNLDSGYSIALDTGGNVHAGGSVGSASRSDDAAFLLRLRTQAFSLSITDANGQPVQGLMTNADGWPVLNASGSGVLANPLTVTAQFVNEEQTSTSLLVQFDAASTSGNGRFWAESPSGASCAGLPTYQQGNQYSFTSFTDGCDAPAMDPNESRSFSWKVWVQPSMNAQISFQARLRSSTLDLLAEDGATVSVPQAHIRPVVIVPGIMGSYTQNNQWVLDPILGTYEGLTTNLRVLGYEDETTIVPFPYQWYGALKDPSNPNDVNQHAQGLGNKISTWWIGKIPPAYVDATRFDLVAHSTGGLITRQYVATSGIQSKLHTVLLVAVPNRGAPAAYMGWEAASTLSESPITQALQTFMFKILAGKAGCATFGFPTTTDLFRYIQGKPCAFGAQPGIPLIRELLPTTQSQNTVSGYPYLYRSDTPLQGPTNTTLDQLSTTAVVDQFVQTINTDGKLYVVYSDNIATWKSYDVVQDISRAPMWMNGQAVLVTELPDRSQGTSVDDTTSSDEADGDGTVPKWSADLSRITSPALRQSVVQVILPNIGHSAFFNAQLSSGAQSAGQQPPVQQIIARLINTALDGQTDNPWITSLPVTEPDLHERLESARRLVFWNECPVTMLITDAQGRRVGSLPNGQVVNEIPDAVYSGDLPGDDPEYISIPNPATGVYTVTVTGQRAEPFRISGQVISGTMNTRLGLFTGIAQPGQTLTYTTRPLENTVSPRMLLVDDGADTATTSLYLNALAQLGRTSDTWDTALLGTPELADIYTYDTIIWSTGVSSTLTTPQLAMLSRYVGDGGALLLSGQDADAGITDTVVLSQTIHAQVQTATTNSQQIAGQDLLNGLSLSLNGGSSANNQTTPTSYQALTGAIPLGIYTDGTGASQAVGVRTNLLNGRLAVLGFGIEGIQSTTTRVTVLDRLLHWLEIGEQPPSFPATDILDDFNRADGSVGSNWTGANASYSIQGNTLANLSGNASTLMWNTGFGADQEVYTTLSAIDSTSNEIDLVLKAQDTGECNLLEAWYQPNRGTVQVWTCHNWGTWIQHGSDIPVTFQAGDQFGVRAKADGTVEVYKNGTVVGSVTVSTDWPYRANVGRVGIWLIDAPGTVLDNFGGGTLP